MDSRGKSGRKGRQRCYVGDKIRTGGDCCASHVDVRQHTHKERSRFLVEMEKTASALAAMWRGGETFVVVIDSDGRQKKKKKKHGDSISRAANVLRRQL